VTFDVLMDGIIGAVIGGAIVAAGTFIAQIWSFREMRKSARAEQSISAAADLLNVLFAAKDTLRLLPYTEAAAGSPLSYGERGDRARPILDELRRAVFTKVPMLTDSELATRFRLFAEICQFTASTSVDASDLRQSVTEADAYADHLRACLIAHIDKNPLPAAPELAITARAVARQQIVIASNARPGQVVTRDDTAA